MLFPKGHCQMVSTVVSHIQLDWQQLLLMLALVLTPVKTTTGRCAGQELIDPLKLEITFSADGIYHQPGFPSLLLKDNSRGYFYIFWLAHKVVLNTTLDWMYKILGSLPSHWSSGPLSTSLFSCSLKILFHWFVSSFLPALPLLWFI